MDTTILKLGRMISIDLEKCDVGKIQVRCHTGMMKIVTESMVLMELFLHHSELRILYLTCLTLTFASRFSKNLRKL